MSLLPPLPIMESWRREGLTPLEVKARADTWVREALAAIRRPVPRPPQPKKQPQPPKVRPQSELRPVVPRRFPPRPKDGRSQKTRQGRPVNRKLPELKTLVELYQTHTIQEIATIYKAAATSVGNQLKKANAVALKREARREARKQAKLNEQANLKLPSTETLVELYKIHSLREIGAMYGATAEAVAHHLRKVGAIEQKRRDKEAADLERIRELRGQGMSWERMAKILRRGEGYLRRLAKEAGIEVNSRPALICPKCDTGPYARGLCHRCYEWVRRNKGKLLPEEQARVAERAKLSQGPGRYHRGLRPESIEKARKIQGLRQKGLTFDQIRAETGISSSTACRLLKRCRDHLDKTKEV